MKHLFVFLVGIVVFCYGFYLDGQLITYVLTQFPASAHEWLGLIKIALWIVTFSTTLCLSLVVATLVVALLRAILGIK